jgi:Phage tail protein
MATRLMYPTYDIEGLWAANVIDAQGNSWGVSTQDASNLPGTKLKQSDRPYGDGSYRANNYRASRTINLTGWMTSANRLSTDQARDLIATAFPDGSQQTLTIDNGNLTKTIAVELASDIKVAFNGNPYSFTWQLTLWAADGRYSQGTQLVSTSLPTAGAVGLDWATGGGLDWATGGGLDWGSVASSGTMTLVNNGTAPIWPTFTFTGPLNVPILTAAGGQQIGYLGNLGVGDSLVVVTDPYKRSVQLNGTDRFTLLTPASWFSVPPKSSVSVALQASGGSGTLSASSQSASW